MSSSSGEENDTDLDWSNLKTIKDFDVYDGGVQSKIGKLQYKESNLTGLYKVVNMHTASTPVSLLVESLVRQLCTFIEPEKTKSHMLYMKICEHLHQINLIDKTYAMGEFEMMRSQYQRALYTLLKISRGEALPVELSDSKWPLAESEDLDWSRYHKEFEEIGFIAGGGYGKVYKAKHKLDGIVYAIKKITIQSTLVNNVLGHLEEVKTFASLNHHSIVSYKAAWLEPLLVPALKDSSDSDSDETPSSETAKDDVDCDRDVSNASYIVFETTSTTTAEETVEENNKYRLANRKINVQESQPHVKLKWAILFIQMTLCQLTLKEFLEERNNSSDFEDFYAKFIERNRNHPDEQNEIHTSRSFDRTYSEDDDEDDVSDHPTHLEIVTNIFTQLINGLSYIHSKKIVHHDIKPSNIFVSVDSSGKINVQLGDFGLACPLQSAHSGTGFGTPLYAAPEQLQGKCDFKSDIYSLGIVLLELLLPFSTEMERANAIKDIKKGDIPERISVNFKSLLKRLLDNRPHKRPDTSQLIEIMSKLSSNKDQVINELQRKLSEQDCQIQLLMKQVEEHKKDRDVHARDKDKEIELLKAKISEMELRQGKSEEALNGNDQTENSKNE